MGYFSWDCNGCGFSLRECRNCSVDWMGKGVCLTPRRFARDRLLQWLRSTRRYDRPSHHARDQGACHALHGTPFPKPTSPEWFHTGQMWKAINSVLYAYGQLLCDIDYAREEGLWKAITPERQHVLSFEYETDQCARRAANKARWEEYLHSDVDEEMPPEKELDPKTYQFDGVVHDYMWLGHFISMAKKDR